MTVDAFLDTNVLVYAAVKDDETLLKRRKALSLIDLHRTLDDDTGEAWLADIEKAYSSDRDALRDPWA